MLIALRDIRRATRERSRRVRLTVAKKPRRCGRSGIIIKGWNGDGACFCQEVRRGEGMGGGRGGRSQPGVAL